MELKCNSVDSSYFALMIEEGIKIIKNDGHGVNYQGNWNQTKCVKELFKERGLAKCFEWSVLKEDSNALAVGLTNGKVVLCYHENKMDFAYRKEFSARCSRPCTSVAWNPVNPNLIACGFDRHRSDQSLFVWDVSTYHSVSPDKSKISIDANLQLTSPSPGKFYPKPKNEFGYAESVNSVIWLRQEPLTLTAGMNGKTLRMYDIRTQIKSTTAQSTISSKAVYGLCQDPLLDKRLATFFENQVHIWDTRNFTKPATILTEIQNVVKIGWCPTRCGLIATLSNGVSAGRSISVYDMKYATATGSDRLSDIQYYPLDQVITPFNNSDEAISTFTWHESKNVSNQLVSISKNGTINSCLAFEKISVSSDNGSNLLASINGRNHSYKLINNTTNILSTATIMKDRALSGYGMDNTNLTDLENDQFNLKYFWYWIKRIKAKTKELQDYDKVSRNTIISTFEKKKNYFAGLNTFIRHSRNDSIAENFKWHGIPGQLNMVYVNAVRSDIINLCEWFTMRELNLQEKREEFRNKIYQYTDIYRASAVAMWHLDMELAIKVLNNSKSQSSDSTLIAMALSGYTGSDKTNPLWKNMCLNLQQKLTNPYLKATCSYLISQPNSGLYSCYQSILDNQDIHIQDRVGFACMYLSDENLFSYMETLSNYVISSGNLEGVLLTGLNTDEGVELLESYVDKTGDIQSVVLALLQTSDATVLKNKTISFWVEEYKNMLCSWKLWKKHACIQIQLRNISSSNQFKAKKDIVAQCNYCQKPLNRVKHSTGRGRSSYVMPGQKTGVCAKCQKPSPRCSVCSLHPECIEVSKDEKTSSNLLTWCQSCKHTGHAEHLEAWFAEHLTCPVSGCTCTCGHY